MTATRQGAAAGRPRQQARVAAIAALLASAGDLLLLLVANARQHELSFGQLAPAWLWLGGIIGVVAIPFYALGYRAAARLVAGASPRAARAVFVLGAAAAIVGSVIHGVTAAYIYAELGSPASGREPLESIASSGPVLPALWALAAAFVIAASALFAWFVGRGRTAAPRSTALLNPALVSIAIGSVGLPWLLLRSFLTPLAPNLAHLLFFSVCACVASPRIGRETPGVY